MKGSFLQSVQSRAVCDENQRHAGRGDQIRLDRALRLEACGSRAAGTVSRCALAFFVRFGCPAGRFLATGRPAIRGWETFGRDPPWRGHRGAALGAERGKFRPRAGADSVRSCSRVRSGSAPGIFPSCRQRAFWRAAGYWARARRPDLSAMSWALPHHPYRHGRGVAWSSFGQRIAGGRGAGVDGAAFGARLFLLQRHFYSIPLRSGRIPPVTAAVAESGRWLQRAGAKARA